MSSVPDPYGSIFFFLGLWAVAGCAWQRFNEPSFPVRGWLPHTVLPLRYLFLRSAYQRARFTYLVVSLLVYCLLAVPGSSIIQALSNVGVKDLPAGGWSLLTALVLVGLAPNSNVKWLTIFDAQLRSWVHAWFLVPYAIERTIGLLEDARYEPPHSQLNLVPNPLRERVRNDLMLPLGTLRYRWARVTMLLTSLRRMDVDAVHPLQRAAFEPFQDDFAAICRRYKVLGRKVAGHVEDFIDQQTDDDNVIWSIDALLRQIYAYICWGIRYQANSEQEVDRTLKELGFRVPQRGGRPLFDIVAPAIALVALITVAFWLTEDAVSRMIGVPGGPTLSGSVVSALSSATAASLMYGQAILIALKTRAAQIEQKTWREASPRCLIPIAITAGLVAWAVIIVLTVLFQLPDTLRSLMGLAQLVSSFARGDAANWPNAAEWSFLPIKVATALPWLLAGATVSVILAKLVGGDVRRTDKSARMRDAIMLAVGLSFAVASAQLIQTAFSETLNPNVGISIGLVLPVGFAGFLCGAVIGFMVPYACRANIVTPLDPSMARALQDLLSRAETALGSRAGAEDWVFTPCYELGGITPAEAFQYKTYAVGVFSLLDSEAPSQQPIPVGNQRGRRR